MAGLPVLTEQGRVLTEEAKHPVVVHQKAHLRAALPKEEANHPVVHQKDLLKVALQKVAADHQAARVVLLRQVQKVHLKEVLPKGEVNHQGERAVHLKPDQKVHLKADLHAVEVKEVAKVVLKKAHVDVSRGIISNNDPLCSRADFFL